MLRSPSRLRVAVQRVCVAGRRGAFVAVAREATGLGNPGPSANVARSKNTARRSYGCERRSRRRGAREWEARFLGRESTARAPP